MSQHLENSWNSARQCSINNLPVTSYLPLLFLPLLFDCVAVIFRGYSNRYLQAETGMGRYLDLEIKV